MTLYSINLKSRILFMPTSLNVLTPDPEFCTDGTVRRKKPWKVLWLLHGANGDQDTWIQQTNLCRYAEGRDLVVVLPSALNSDYANHDNFATGYRYTDHFFGELMPFIQDRFSVSADPEANYLAGLSMGGSGAFLYAFTHPERFSGVAALSSSIRESEFLKPYRDLTAQEFRKLVLSDRKAFPTEFGDPAQGITFKEINMITKYPTVGEYIDSYECMWERLPEVAARKVLPRIYVSCGTEDDCYEKILQFRDYADSLGLRGITYDFVPGYGHDFEFWDLALRKTLDFFKL